MNATNVKETVGPQKSIYYGMSLFQIYTLSDNLFLKRFPYPPQKVNYINYVCSGPAASEPNRSIIGEMHIIM
jgi:hypothetical protein